MNGEQPFSLPCEVPRSEWHTAPARPAESQRQFDIKKPTLAAFVLLCGLSNNLYLLTSSQGALPKFLDSSQSTLLPSKTRRERNHTL